MKTLHRFILRSYIQPFATTFVISVFILFMQFLWKWVDELVGKGLDFDVVSKLFFFSALSTVPLALPMSVLLSSLMTFGNLAENYELAALKSSGMSLMRVMRPLIIFSAVVTILAFLFSNYLLPSTNLNMLSTLFDIRQQKPALNIKEGVFYNEIDGYSIRIKKIDKDGQTLNSIMIYDHTDQAGNTSLTLAEKGKMYMTSDKGYLMLELHNGTSYSDMVNQRDGNTSGKPFMRTAFKDQLVRLDLSGFKMQTTEKDLFKDNHQMLNGEQLLAYIDTMQAELNHDRSNFYTAMKSAYLQRTNKYWNDTAINKIPVAGNFLDSLDKTERAKVYELALNGARNCKSAAESKVNEIDSETKSILRFKIEFWRKYTLSFACFIMFFIGAPLGAIIRKGGLGMPVVISIVFFIVFWVLSIVGEKLSKEGTIPPEFGMWIGCILYLPLGIWLTRKATADSGLFDMEGYKSALLKLVPFRKKKNDTDFSSGKKTNGPEGNSIPVSDS